MLVKNMLIGDKYTAVLLHYLIELRKGSFKIAGCPGRRKGIYFFLHMLN
jgi:hypothetical protein